MERYLSAIVPELARRGHEVAFWHETDLPADREPIALPDGAPAWCARDLGLDRSLAALREWKPDLVYTHVVHDPETEARVQELAPAVFFAHAYYGTCVSGTKTHKSPVPTPCGRRLGPGCLLHYYPHRCGGLSPLTMLRDYARERSRLEVVARYAIVAANSRHMRDEYLRHGLDPERVRVAPLPVEQGEPRATRPRGEGDGWNLLFLGRMDPLKGGGVLLDALPAVSAELAVPLRVVFAGDGPARADWERAAAGLRARCPDVAVEFTGWVPADGLAAIWARTDLLVVPSLWPEPFGLVGPEAGTRGIPAAAFATGGIPDWLAAGVNGHLAPADPPTAAGLAAAIARCLRDPAEHVRLGAGAAVVARTFNIQRHYDALMQIFQSAVGTAHGEAFVHAS